MLGKKLIITLILFPFFYSLAYAQEIYFKANKECDLYNDLERHENIDDVKAVIGKKYKVVKHNRKDYLYIEAQGVYPENRWVNKSCGSIYNLYKQDQKTIEKKFIPFFVQSEKNVTKDQPVIPTLTEFDHSALKACGDWGHHVESKDLNALLVGEELQNIYEKLDHTVITKNAGLDIFKQELVNIWLENDAFEHVVCGQPGHRKDNKLGGLHYVGRYLEMQENEWGGLNKGCTKEDVARSIYTIGVDFITPEGKVAVKCPSGYEYNMSVYDIIIMGTNAFKESIQSMTKSKKHNIACVYSDKKNNFVFVMRNNAIVTFYPDLTIPSQMSTCG